MQFTFIDNSLYYYDYKIFNGELSYMLFVVALTIMFFYKDIIKYISYVCLCINVIGIYISYLNAIEYNLIAIMIGGILSHMIFLYPLINIKKYFKPNFIQFLLIILGLFIIYFLPYWPYKVITRTTMSYMLVTIYILLILIYCYFFQYKFSEFLH
jgi:TRAP-type uncharacterized transport system fused permease subunit